MMLSIEHSPAVYVIMFIADWMINDTYNMVFGLTPGSHIDQS